MKIEENVSLKGLNTFGINASAKYFAAVDSRKKMQELLEQKAFQQSENMVLGGGSNILLTQDFDGLVIKNDFQGIELIKSDEEHVYVRAGAGVNWHSFVLHCIDNNYAGIENLSLIPGNVGASPMQNIGAYGVEIKDVFHELEAIDLRSGEVETFNSADCEFGYRNSIFKNRAKGQYIITAVTLRLNKTPQFNTSYGAIERELENMGVQDLSIAAISQAVINIRSSKLPDPKKIGNAGSFFKNPVVSIEKYEEIIKNYPNLAAYKVDDNAMKLAAGWLIEQCGWKGKRFDSFGVHVNQALVLVNYGGAKGSDIYNLSERIKQSVLEKFGVELEREVNII